VNKIGVETERGAATGENLEQVWKDHLAGEFVNKDVEATLATMHMTDKRIFSQSLACERIYWDQATVLRQVGLLPK
jgi:hypothetical protein